MALYEYQCPNCNERFEKRMPMTDVLQLVPCPSCGKQAKKIIGNFAVVGSAEPAVGDGAAPWDDDGSEDAEDDGDDASDEPWGGAHDLMPGHGHSHGPGGHSH